jgi:hypothetical protein
MGREIKSGKFKISVPLDEALRSNYKKVCEEVLKTSMNDHLRNHIQATVKKFKSMVPDEPKVPV